MLQLKAPLGEWIREHQVTWELLPHYEMHGHSRVGTGYDLALFARHPGPLHGDPGCPECFRIYAQLREVASAALPLGTHSSHVVFSPFHAAFHMRKESDWVPEVLLNVEITPHGPVAPAGLDERSYAKEMEDALLKLGAQPGRWQQRR